MKSMNTMMPLMSAVFCLTLPVGIGIYWIAGAVIRTAQQFFINKHLDRVDMDDMVRKNMETAAKKNEKRKEISAQQVTANASRKTKSISSVAKHIHTEEDASSTIHTPKPGSIAAKANMVRSYDETHRRK